MEGSNQRDSFAGSRLFVYGTLRRGFRSHGFLQQLHARFLATARVRGRLYDLGEYPGAVESAGSTDRVAGELYFLPRPLEAFRILDKFEGCNTARPAFNLFDRKRAAVTVAGGREVRAWIYWLAQRRIIGRCISSGNYAARRT